MTRLVRLDPQWNESRVEDAPPTKVYFAAGDNGEHEGGDWHFWCAVGDDEFGRWTIVARALCELPAEERFMKMNTEQWMDKEGESRIAYRTMWRRLETCSLIRPASVREVTQWMASHSDDAKYAEPFVYLGDERHTLPRSAV